jgi:hypothetical protein
MRRSARECDCIFNFLGSAQDDTGLSHTGSRLTCVRVFGLNWRPLYQLKIAARQGLDGFGEYAVSMTTFVFYLPTILLVAVHDPRRGHRGLADSEMGSPKTIHFAENKLR